MKGVRSEKLERRLKQLKAIYETEKIRIKNSEIKRRSEEIRPGKVKPNGKVIHK